MNKDSIRPLKDLLDNIRDIDGFPIANDEDIIRLSDVPFYTACPNPYLKDYIEKHGSSFNPNQDKYNKTPYVGDVSEGKTDPLYNAHTYHTKVPYKAIVKFLNHYTQKGDIILDPFCGSGMTGIAAQETSRYAILLDLSPSATFISYNFNKELNIHNFKETANEFLKKLEEDLGWMYETNHDIDSKAIKYKPLISDSKIKGQINYVVWSDIYICPYCENEFIFWDVAVNKANQKVNKNFKCSNCLAELNKRNCNRSEEIVYDSVLRNEIKIVKRVPVLINYFVGKERYKKIPDKKDLEILQKIDNTEIPYWFPINQMPKGYNTRQPRKSHYVEYVYQFYTKRNLWILAYLNDLIINLKDKRIKNMMKVLLQSFLFHTSILNRKVPGGIGRHLSGTLYIPSLSCEVSIFEMYKRKLKDFLRAFNNFKNNMISTSSATSISKLIKENTIDYIFTDPPFGSNLMYSELSYIWEAWLKVFTNNSTEAIINEFQNKDIDDYRILMEKSFSQMFKILKPNHWLTIVFHNSKASVWNAIQEAITRTGFIIAQVSVLDKKQGSFKQVVYASTVKNDLIINAYKPREAFSKRFLKNAGENMELEFIEEHFNHLPIRPNIERTENMLFSKLLAHYVENGFKVKYDASNFFEFLKENLIEIDGYWFLENQIRDYNEWKRNLSLDQMKKIIEGQQIVFINDENTALKWINYFLTNQKEYGEIYTAFNQVLTKTNDQIPELKLLLERNFISENNKYRRPSNLKEKKTISKKRENDLDQAYDEILKRAKESKGKIQTIRKEAILHGLSKNYNDRNYQEILFIAEKLHNKIIESNGVIMDYINIAKIKTQEN